MAHEQADSSPGEAPPSDRTPLTKAIAEKLRIPRSATPYFVAALLAAMAMGWYFFLFVPQKLEYFVGLRFRTLAVASGQIKSKAESLGESLNIAPAPGDLADAAAAQLETPTARYLRLLVPDIRLEPAPARGLQLVGRPGTDPGQSLRASVAWDRVASQAAAASATEFDDLVLADAHGEVVWQREKTTPRVGSLAELLYAPDDKGTLMSQSWAIRTVVPAVDATKGLPKTAALKPVRVGSTSTLMLVQAVHLESPYIANKEDQKSLYVAGFVSRSRLQQQAMRIPLAWLMVIWLPIAVLFLALPFIKLATMQAKERFNFVNLTLMAIGTITAAGLAAVIPMGPRPVSDAGDAVLDDIATRVDRHLGDETRNVLALARSVASVNEGAAGLVTCQVENWVKQWGPDGRLCDLWVPLARLLDDVDKPVPELDVAVWIDDRGDQVRKLTTKVQLTGQTSHRPFQHFQNLTSGSLWSIGEGGAVPFTIEPLRAPTTAELGVVFAMPLKDLGGDLPAVRTATATGGAAVRPAAQFLALNVRPHAVVDAVMPPGYGFAIIAPDGKVLFHSNDGLSLEENFFEEVSNAQGVRERMQMERAVVWSGDYHGTPHRILMRPVSTLQGARWKVVAFQDLSPGLASIVDHQSGTFRVNLVNIALLLVAALVAWAYMKSRGLDIRDLTTSGLSLDPARLWGLVVLMVLAAAALYATGRPSAYQWADMLFLFFVLLPSLALGVSVYARVPHTRSDRHRRSWLVRFEPRLVRFELAMLVVLVGAAPAAGFARIVHRVQDVQATERWLEIAHQRIVEHAVRARARAISPGYLPATRTRLVANTAFQGGARQNALDSYISASPVFDGRNIECTIQPESGQVFVRGLLDWAMFSADRSGRAKVFACAGSNRLQIADKEFPLAATVWHASDESSDDRAPAAGAMPSRWFTSLDWERWTLAILILSGTIAAAYWAQRRLRAPKAVTAATFESALGMISSDGNEGIMLVGPPRTRKDALVKDVVTKLAGFAEQPDGSEPIHRIKLLDTTIDEEFVKTTLEEVSRRAKQPARLDAQKRLWIHVSNLETQLITDKRRTAVLELLEKLLDRADGEPCKVVVVTTSIDPIANFHEIFTKEREGIYGNEIPEVELSRSSLLLSRFRRCYLPIQARKDPDPWWNYAPRSWAQTLDWEAAGYPPLVEVANAIKKTPRDDAEPPACSELARTFRSKALAAYDLLWESCTRSEKLVLIQLAQEGFVTTRNCEVVWGLIHKGLIVERPGPAIFNNSFRAFLRHIEHDHVVEQWEAEDGSGLWMVAGRLIGSSLIAGGLFYLTTQDFSVDSLLPVVSGTGIFGAPVVRALLARVTMRGSAMAG